MKGTARALLSAVILSGAVAQAADLDARLPRHPQYSTTPALEGGLFDDVAEPTALEVVPDVAEAPRMLAVHRFVKSDGNGHFLSTDQNRGAAFTYEGVTFSVLAEAAPDTRAIYECSIRAIARQFFSTDAGCEGQDFASVLGYVYVNQVAGTRPVQRCYHPTGGVHLFSANAAECTAAGYQVEGVYGYVP